VLGSPRAMARLRIAHFSDVHFTLDPFAHPRESLHGKRLASFFSYLVGGRRERFTDVGPRIAELLRDVDAMAVDHAICTGDLTASSLPAEIDGIAELFGPRLARPERFTVLPGNHDRYVARVVADGTFERRFGTLCPARPGEFPFEKRLADGVRLVGIDVARPTSFLDSSGLCGERQRGALRDVLASDTESITFVAMHYGLVRWRGQPDRRRHRMRDYREVMAILESTPARIALVLHGHMHGAFTVPIGPHAAVCAGSATDLLVDCGYFVYELDLDTRAITVERRHWNRDAGRFEPSECASFERAVRDRRGAHLRFQLPFA